MPIINFEELCRGFCELAGFRPPKFAPDGRDTAAFSARLRGIPVTLLAFGRSRDRTAFLVAELGTLPAGEEHAGWLALIEANSAIPGIEAPRFSRNPRTGEAVLQWACPLQDVTAVEVYQRVLHMVEVVLCWRRDRTLGPWGSFVSSAAHGSASAAQAAAKFHLLYQELCDALDEPAQAAAADGGARAIEINVDGVDMVIAHLPRRLPDVALVGVPFGNLPTLSQHECVVAMMDANFLLATEAHGAAFCRDATSGDLLLRYAFALTGAKSRQCLGQLVSLASFVREWMRFEPDAAAPVASSQPTRATTAEYA